MDEDEKYMDRALDLAKLGRGKVNPNPLVGAVIVKNGNIIGEGYHKAYGMAHAERNAVKNALEDVSGSTIYINLEPCAHFGKTPPCVDLIIQKKFKKVVIGMLDPNKLVEGKSVEKLRKNGIEVIVGIKEDQCKTLNEIFIKYITLKIPFILLKSGMSIDGKIATSTGESKWITSKEAREDSHSLRNTFSAIMVGVNTIIEDDPELTCRIDNGRNPIRVIVDSKLRIPLNSKVIRNSDKKTIIATTEKANLEKKKELINMGIKVIQIKETYKKVALNELVKELGLLEIDSILIEGGGEVNFSALKENIVDKIMFYMAPKIIGGKNSKSSISGQGFSQLDSVPKIKNISYKGIGEDLLIEGYIDK